MDPGVRSHGMKADPLGYLWSKYECFLMSGWWDILHSSCLHVKFWSNSTNGTEVWTNERTNKRTYERKDENYIPLGINAGGIIKDGRWQCSFSCLVTCITGLIWQTFILFSNYMQRLNIKMLAMVSLHIGNNSYRSQVYGFPASRTNLKFNKQKAKINTFGTCLQVWARFLCKSGIIHKTITYQHCSLVRGSCMAGDPWICSIV